MYHTWIGGSCLKWAWHIRGGLYILIEENKSTKGLEVMSSNLLLRNAVEEGAGFSEILIGTYSS